jgi:hypothetical protein
MAKVGQAKGQHRRPGRPATASRGAPPRQRSRTPPPAPRPARAPGPTRKSGLRRNGPPLALVHGPSRPVFLDETGRRRRRLTAVGSAVGVVGVGYLLALGSVLAAPSPPQPTTPTPPAHVAYPPAPIR